MSKKAKAKNKARKPAKRSSSRSKGAKTKGRSSAKPKAGGAAPHPVVTGSSRPPARGARRVRDADPRARFEVTIALRGPQLPDAESLMNRTVPMARSGSRYAASSKDAKTVAKVLRKFGLKIEQTSLVTRSMRVSGTVKAMEAAFHPQLGIYKSVSQGEFRDRSGPYKVPAELHGIVTAVLGFGERRVAYRNRRALQPRVHGLAPLRPADVESRYSFPSGQAENQKIAVAEFGGGYFVEDLEAYCVRYGRPVPKVEAISVNRPAYTLKQVRQMRPAEREDVLDDSGEVMMDIQIIAGLCPKSEISVYFASFDQKGWVDLLNQAIVDKPVAISVSWGSAEDSPDWSDAARTAINDRLNLAAAQGITVCVAAGDDGSGDAVNDGRAHVDFPGSSPFVLSVGGTMMTDTSPSEAKNGAKEEVWWEDPGRRERGGATGGGVSMCFDRPAWQNVTVRSLNRDSPDGRVVPDVAALAGPPMFELVTLGRLDHGGGTSASAPLWASLIARVNALLPPSKQQRFLTPMLYRTDRKGKSLGETVCRDITVGNNKSLPKPGRGYSAGPGFDAVTGWGVPIGTALLEGL